jgi:hypothetical protein
MLVTSGGARRSADEAALELEAESELEEWLCWAIAVAGSKTPATSSSVAVEKRPCERGLNANIVSGNLRSICGGCIQHVRWNGGLTRP